MKKTKLTVIVDNIPQGDIKGEWGLSILVEYEDKKILVDAGASGLFAENMKKLGFCIRFEGLHIPQISRRTDFYGDKNVTIYQQG